MERKLETIINEGKKNGKTVSEINAELKKAGATFQLDYKMSEDGPVTGWTEKEMQEGFREPAEKAKPVQRRVDMRRRPEFANTTQTQVVMGVTYRVTYNENGYAVKAIRG